MSQKNVDLVRQAYETWNRGELRWFLDHVTEDFEFRPGLGFLDIDEVIRGMEGWMRFADAWPEAWEDITLSVEQIEDLDDRVVALLSFDGRARGSAVVVSVRVDHVATVTDGRLSKLVSTRAMSQDDVAMIFQRGIEAYSRGDYEAALVGFDPAIEWRVDASLAPDATTYYGHAGVRRFWGAWAEAISGMVVEVEECRCVAADQVLAISRAHGTGSGSGAPVASGRFAHIADFRDGRFVRVRLYGSVKYALEALGLRNH